MNRPRPDRDRGRWLNVLQRNAGPIHPGVRLIHEILSEPRQPGWSWEAHEFARREEKANA